MNSDTSTKVSLLLAIHKKLQVLVNIPVELDISAKSEIELFTKTVFGRACKNHYAIVLLCEQGYGEDALILTRTLLEIMITYAYITKADSEQRFARYKEFEKIIRKRGANYINQKSELSSEFSKRTGGELISTLKNLNEECERLVDEYGDSFKYHWSGKKIIELLKDIEREDLYETVYRLQCSHAHVDISGMTSVLSLRDGSVEIDIGASHNLVLKSLVIAFDIFFHILNGISEDSGWNLGDDLKKIEQEFLQVM